MSGLQSVHVSQAARESRSALCLGYGVMIWSQYIGIHRIHRRSANGIFGVLPVAARCMRAV
jgi:hypothetical protein